MDRNQKLLVVEGAASAAYLIITQGALFTAIALFFRLDAWWLGVTASFPLVFQVMQILVPPLVARTRNRPALMNLFNALRLVWLIPVLAAFAGYIAPWLFILCFALSQAVNAFAANVWMCLMRDLVPESSRGSYLGKRNLYLGLVTILMLPLFSLMLDRLSEPWNVASVVGSGMLATLVAILAMLGVRDCRNEAPACEDKTGNLPSALSPAWWRSLWQQQLARLQDTNFRTLLLAFFAWNLVIQLAAPFYALHMITNLEVPLPVIGLLGTGVSVISLLTFRLWGKVADRLGHKSVLITGLVIVSLLPLMWFFMGDPVWPVLLVLDVFWTALGWSAVNLTLLTLPLETSEKADSGYFALLNAVGGLGGISGALLGGTLAMGLQELRLELFGVTVAGLQVLFGLNGLMRLATVGLFVRVKTQRYVRPSTLVMNVLSLIARRSSLRPEERNYR